jgi:hypothetical protein
MSTPVHPRFRSRIRVVAAGVAATVAVGLIAVPAADAVTKKRTVKRPVKRPVAPKVTPLPPTTAPAAQPLPPTTAAVVTTAAPTTVAPAVLTISSDVPRRLAVPGGSATYVLTAKSRSTEPTTFSVSGLPAGVRAVLATNPTTSTTTMTLTTTVGITPGGYQSFLVTAIGGGASATLALELVVDTTAPAATTTAAPGVQQSFAPTAEVLLAGPIFPGGATFVAYRVNLNRPPGVSGSAIVSAGSVPAGLALGISQTSVSGSSFDVSFSASSSAVSGFYQPTVSVVLGGYTVLIAFPVQINVAA